MTKKKPNGCSDKKHKELQEELEDVKGFVSYRDREIVRLNELVKKRDDQLVEQSRKILQYERCFYQFRSKVDALKSTIILLLAPPARRKIREEYEFRNRLLGDLSDRGMPSQIGVTHSGELGVADSTSVAYEAIARNSSPEIWSMEIKTDKIGRRID